MELRNLDEIGIVRENDRSQATSIPQLSLVVKPGLALVIDRGGIHTKSSRFAVAYPFCRLIAFPSENPARPPFCSLVRAASLLPCFAFFNATDLAYS